MGYTLNLDLGRVADASVAAVTSAINATLADCVTESKQIVPVWKGNLKGAIEMEPAKAEGSLILGSFGVYNADIDYAIWQEIGYHVRKGAAKPRARRARQGLRAPRRVTGAYRFIPGKFYLRRSAQKHFPTLASRISEFSS